ncbi:MAG TPA: hypothetical protein VK541_14680 [Pedobacter sp.]|uniref:hypothetical protein n=1 Tax=Pedobacter sp. TaxID=1411316 RepID=UPI002B74E7D5|nr:hypothetical protein [Pedobacter sp.]HMI03726.1 hypothetical protein [Pedobacter sp.]
MLEPKYAVAEEIALNEVMDFVLKYNRKTKDHEELKDKYPDVIEFVKLGLLNLESGKPVLKLTNPIKTDEDGVAIETLNFKTRILASEQRRIASGVNLSKDAVLYLHKSMAHLIGQPLAMLDKFDQEDIKVIEQLCTLFI